MKTCSWCQQTKKKEEFYACKTTSDYLHSYCASCFNLINELNRTVREGPTKLVITYPYDPWDKFLYAYATGDYGCRHFRGVSKPTGPQSIPTTITHGRPLRKPGEFTENALAANFTIYFVLDPINWLVKIGRTSNLKQRLTFYPATFILLGVIQKQTRTKETDLHHKFKAYAVGHEWFTPVEPLMLHIANKVDTPDILD